MATLTVCVGKIAKKKGVSIAELADRAGIAYNTAASLYRGGVARVDLETISRIGRALGVSPKDLLEEVEQESEMPVAA